MTTGTTSNDLRGRTVRLSWTDGPTKGTTQEHIFHTDGTVEWRSVAGSRSDKSDDQQAKATAEKPKYASEPINDTVALLSYLSKSGYTLTVALNFQTGDTVGVASNEKTWMPVHGHFEVVQ